MKLYLILAGFINWIFVSCGQKEFKIWSFSRDTVIINSELKWRLSASNIHSIKEHNFRLQLNILWLVDGKFWIFFTGSNKPFAYLIQYFDFFTYMLGCTYIRHCFGLGRRRHWIWAKNLLMDHAHPFVCFDNLKRLGIQRREIVRSCRCVILILYSCTILPDSLDSLL